MMQVAVGWDFQTKHLFAEVGNEGVAEGGYSYGADVTD